MDYVYFFLSDFLFTDHVYLFSYLTSYELCVLFFLSDCLSTYYVYFFLI